MFWRGVWGYLPVQAVQALVGFGSVVAFTRLLSPEAYGQYALAYSVAALVQTGFLTWLEAAMARFHVAETERGDPAGHHATLQRSMLLMLVIGVAAATPLVILLPVAPALKLAIGAGLAAFGLKSALRLIQERMRAEGDVRGFAISDVLATGGGFLLGMAFAAAGWGGAGPLVGVGVAGAVALLVLTPGEWRRGRGGRVEPARLRRYAAYGVPLGLSLILAQVLFNIDRFLIAAFLDEASVGAYHAGYGVGFRLIDVLFVWIGLAGGPATVAALERGGRAALDRAASEQASLMLLLGVPATVGLALVSDPLNQILVGEALRAQSAQVTPWIALGAFFAGINTHYLMQAFTLGRRPGLFTAAMAVPALSNIALNLVLVPRFGVIGAAWGTAASFAIGAAVAALLGRRALHLPMPWPTLVRSAFAAAVMAAAVSAVPAHGGWAELLLKAAVGAVVYGLAVLVLDPGARRTASGLLRIARERTA